MEAEARAALPDAEATGVEGGVVLAGVPSLIARANLLLRLPTRVLLRLGEFDARDWKKLRRGVLGLPVAAVLPRGAQIAIKAAATRSRLYHTGGIAEHVASALGEAVEAVLAPRVEAGAPLARDVHTLFVRVEQDHVTLSIDTSGERLHQRGWRTEGGDAPLRETLAATLLAIGAHRPDEALLDPMCGSGTIVIEGALRAIGRAPGLDRSFAFERHADFDEAAWRALRDAARAAERPLRAPIIAADADEAQLAVAARNAERAGVAAMLRWEHVSLDKLVAPAATGLVATNPPYGVRVGARGSALPALYDALGRALRGPLSGWRAAVLVEDRELLRRIGAEPRRAVALKNGGLRVWAARVR